MVIFGTIGLVRRFIPCSSGVVAFVRGLTGALFLFGLHVLKKERFSRDALRKNGVRLCASGVLLGANWILLFEAYRYTTVSVATICYYMAPVFVILVSPWLFKEKITLKKGVCACVAVAGMVLVSGILETGLTGSAGVLFGLGAAVLYAAIVVINKKMDGLPANDRTIFQLGVAAVTLLPYVLCTEDFASFAISPFALAMLLVAGVLHTGVAYALYFGSLPAVPAQTAALFSYVDPVVAVLLSALVLKEALSALAAVGVVMVLCSAMLSELAFAPRSRAK